MMKASVAAMLLAGLLPACKGEERIDAVPACLIAADDELVIEINSGSDCAADHEGAKLSCELEPSEGENRWVLTTVYQTGRDPNDGCAGRLFAACSVPHDQAGTVHIDYDRAEFVYDPSVDELPICRSPQGEAANDSRATD